MKPQPVSVLRDVTAYNPGRSACPVDLRLDGNEGRAPSSTLIDALAAAGPEALRRYPDRGPLEARLAAGLDLPPEAVLVTAGADDALDRLCRAYLAPARNLVVAVPTFTMIPRYARLAGAEIREVPWPSGPFPVEAVLDRVDDATGLIAVVTPNNPTGAVATAGDLEHLSAGAPGALLLVDLAYGEFADMDLMPAALALPNAVGVRSLSKAWGLAGLRVGYAAGPPDLIAPLRAAGGPYAVSGPSLVMATAALDQAGDLAANIGRVRKERRAMADILTDLGLAPVPSQGNFVYTPADDAGWIRDGLAGLGVAVRLFGEESGPGHLRISCPGRGADLDRLERALRTVLSPEAVLFDMDGVLADVSGSYRRAIRETARGFGVDLSPGEVASAKRRPGSNNDWVLTRDLLAARGVAVDLAEVTDRFQTLYADLAAGETLIPAADLLERLAARLPLGIVTSRPRADAQGFLSRTGVGDFFTTMICMEDGPEKPDPAPVTLALARLGVQRAWMMGDTVNDMAAARAAGVLPLGLVPPGETAADYPQLLTAAGAGRVLASLADLEEVLP